MKNIFTFLILFFVASCGMEADESNVINSLPAKTNAHSKIDSSLIHLLEDILIIDQNLRIQLDTIRSIYGVNSAEEEMHWKSIQQQDSLNYHNVDSITAKYGWLGIEDVGIQAYEALFYTIQHSSLEQQEKYLPVLSEALEKGKVLPQHFAMLQDRILTSKGQEQVYGTQLGMNELTGEFFVYPVIEPDSIDLRRLSVGLDSFYIYLKYGFEVEWDVQKYKENLPSTKTLLEQRTKNN